jgi:superfamily II DNA or RNA helicase
MSRPAVQASSASTVSLGLTPHGRLVVIDDDAAGAPGPGASIEPALASRLRAAFGRGGGHGLFELGASAVGVALPPTLAFARDLGARYVTALCAHGEPAAPGTAPAIAVPPDDELDEVVAAAPPMRGVEYLTAEVVAGWWRELGAAVAAELAAARGSVEDLLRRHHPAWHTVGRVHFNLAENRGDDDAPFAFLATYTARLSVEGRAQHLPLGKALEAYAGARHKPKLLSLLVPVQRAAEACPWLREMIDAGDVFHPLRWTVAEAARFLGDVATLEAAGVVVRVPAAWGARRPPRPQATVTVGGRPPATLGEGALLDFQVGVTVDGEPLTAAEIDRLLADVHGLALLRGRWVEVDRDRLRAVLDQLGRAEEAARDGVSFAEAMRLVAGAGDATGGAAPRLGADWSSVVAGPWLAETLRGLRTPEALAAVDPGPDLAATLRPYQQVGVRWLHLVTGLGLGACLADDMGLGKTIQILALLVARRRAPAATRRPSLLVAPASLLANWTAELARFAPSLDAIVAHPSGMPAAELRALDPARVAAADLVITSYGQAARLDWLATTGWELVILDEAQAIKNPSAKQTRAVKRLDARARIALTGTPVENRLGDLWSIFDFLDPGLLGTAKQFTAFTRRLGERPGASFAPLRALVRPYILRRLKTDRAVIADLPDKTEVKAYCPLSRKQAALYRQAVDDLAERLRGTGGIQRRGVVLAFLTRFKQICNHPSHWLGDGAWAEADSGKLARLRELAETIAARQEKLLVFTQFRETTAPLAGFLGGVFGRPGVVLTGQTEVRRRHELVRRFQDDDDVPFFVLSVKAGGTGLNLTAASHVVHFDRWWNPAVENQATDRAFRIGQRRNVLVHKFICRGTVEDKIDQMIEAKRQLADDLLDGGAEPVLTELADDELLRLVALDLGAASEDG